jgi:hypothetical protein
MIMIIALLVIPVTFLVGVVAVDASLWQSERRGAQKDSDFSALAGAYQLILGQNKTAAENASITYANTNDEAGNADSPVAGSDMSASNTVAVNDACFPGSTVLPLNSVTVNLDHHSRTFFSSIFGVNIAPQIEGHARACAGSITNPLGLRPFILDIKTSPCFTGGAGNRVPNFGQTCALDFGAQGSTGGANRGIADIEVPDGACSNKGGSGEIEELIEFGAPNVRCGTQTGNTCPNLPGYPNNTWGICVNGQTGNPQKVLNGIAAMLSHEGGCDTRYSVSGDQAGIDDFGEALELIAGPGGSSPNNIYAPRPCNDAGDTSARLITIFSVDEWLGANKEMPIRYFVNVYVTGCKPRNKPFSPKCTGNMSPVGQVEVHGIIIKTFTAEIGDVGVPNAGGAFTISLEE